jgi:hypothetical protein
MASPEWIYNNTAPSAIWRGYFRMESEGCPIKIYKEVEI